MRKSYTVAEANRALPYIRAVVSEVRERYHELQERSREHKSTPVEAEKLRNDLKGEIQVQAQRIKECVGELEALDLQLKDFERGLVDFPADFEGRRILLCWEAEEGEVGHWHELDSGYGGRRPVPAGEPDWPRATVGA